MIVLVAKWRPALILEMVLIYCFGASRDLPNQECVIHRMRE